MKVVLVSTYELGRQPFGLGSPAAWLAREGCDVTCSDLAVEALDETAVRGADLVAFHVPMHTATRLAARAARRVRALNAGAHLCFYGLYAPVNEAYLRELGGRTILGGEFEAGLVSLVRRLAGSREPAVDQPEPRISLQRQRFLVPDRRGLPPLDRYARLQVAHGELRTVGYTEASRGCKHACRHCPIVPVYDGRFRVVQRDVVLEDVRRQVAAGAEHVTFGDPDFFNGPAHGLAVVREMHREFPGLTYDVTIKIEHLLRRREHLPVLRDTGCLFVTSAVESVDDRVLELLAKGHTRADFVETVRVCREAGLPLNPTFVTFTPWTTPQRYADLLEVLLELRLVDHVAPIQYAIRLLIVAGSKLLELEEVRAIAGGFDPQGLVHPWKHPDPRVDRLHADVQHAIREGHARHEDRREIFRRVWKLAREACGITAGRAIDEWHLHAAPPPATVPYLTEPWYC
jgi:radical SAM superfamily enzyme YgiQ (UPF0313 family)